METPIEKVVREYLERNLSIEIKSETNDFHNTDCSTSTQVEIEIKLKNRVIASDSYYH